MRKVKALQRLVLVMCCFSLYIIKYPPKSMTTVSQAKAKPRSMAVVDSESSQGYNSQSFVRQGRDINCYQRSLEELSANKTAKGGLRFAYAWYVSNDIYLCSAFMALNKLKGLRLGDSGLAVDYVLTFDTEFRADDPPDDTIERLLLLWEEEGGLLREFPRLEYPDRVEDSYYEHSYQKFYSFLLFEYERVLFMDADGVPMRDLDHLFLLPLPPNVHLAAPQGYW